MEAELRCPVCRQFYDDPVLLPCCHSVCSACVSRLVRQRSETSPTSAIGFAGEGGFEDGPSRCVSKESSKAGDLRSRSSSQYCGDSSHGNGPFRRNW
jgi:hypothetical protein